MLRNRYIVWSSWLILLIAVIAAQRTLVGPQGIAAVLTLMAIGLFFGIKWICSTFCPPYTSAPPRYTEMYAEGEEEAPVQQKDLEQNENIQPACTNGMVMEAFEDDEEILPTDPSREEGLMPPNDQPNQENNSNPNSGPVSGSTPCSGRVDYLDNVKSFLTFLVVLHHSCCAFGTCGEAWFLIMGLYPNIFQQSTFFIVVLNQAYFMSLFFFISAYFVPTSYDTRGHDRFLWSKATRYWIPAFVCTFGLVPLSIFMSEVAAGWNKYSYSPDVAHAWFLVWLLIFQLVYATLRSTDSSASPPSSAISLPFPSTLMRWIVGLTVCGLAMLGAYELFWPKGLLGMPISIGSFTCDVMFFVMGIVARRNGWLISRIRDQLDIPVWVLRFLVILEAILLLHLLSMAKSNIWIAVGFFCVAGLFCVDMSVAVLEFFQTNLDFSTRFSRFLSDAAYAVYIIHPVVVVGMTWLFVFVYEQLGWGAVVFPLGSFHSYEPLEGSGDGALTLFLGWLFVVVSSQLIVWPLGWCVKQLPVLKHIL